MSDLPTGRQKDWALALGFRFSDHTMRMELSEMLDGARGSYDDPATREQLQMAAEWGLTIPNSATRYDAAGVLST